MQSELKIKKLNSIPMKLINKLLFCHSTTSHATTRIITGIPPVLSYIYYIKLIWYWKFSMNKLNEHDNEILSWYTLMIDKNLIYKEPQNSLKFTKVFLQNNIQNFRKYNLLNEKNFIVDS